MMFYYYIKAPPVSKMPQRPQTAALIRRLICRIKFLLSKVLALSTIRQKVFYSKPCGDVIKKGALGSFYYFLIILSS